MAKAFVAMSGGVDSSAAALLTLQQGDQVTGVTLRLHDRRDGCGGEQDAEDAAAVCAQLGIAHALWEEEEAFRRAQADN